MRCLNVLLGLFQANDSNKKNSGFCLNRGMRIEVFLFPAVLKDKAPTVIN